MPTQDDRYNLLIRKLKVTNEPLADTYFDLSKDNIFIAPKPEKSLLEWFWLVNSRLFFPPLLMWDGLKYAVNSLANRYARDALILPARKKYNLIPYSDEELRQQIEASWKEYAVPENERQPIEDAIQNLRNEYIDFRVNRLKSLSQKDGIKEHAQKRKLDPQKIQTLEESFEQREIKGHSFVVLDEETGSCLHTFEITHENQTKKSDGTDNPIANQRYIIYFNGNEEWVPDAVVKGLTEDHGLNSNLVFFDYTGSGLSSYWDAIHSDKDLLAMGIAQVERLIKKGVNPENIYLKGYSLGGVGAALTAAYCHDRDIKVNLFSDRSFSNSTNLVTGYIRTGASLSNGHKETWFNKILGTIAYPFVRLITALSGYEMNAGDAYNSIPETHKTYAFVRSNKAARTANPPEPVPIDDPIMPHYATLHTYGGIEEKRNRVKSTFKKIKAALSALNAQPAIITTSASAIDDSTQALKVHKLRPRKDAPNNYTANQHLLPLSFLGGDGQQAQGKSGVTIYHDFIKATEKHHHSVAVKR